MHILARQGQTKIPWVEALGWPWEEEHKLSKLLGALFELKLGIMDVDDFLLEKVDKRLIYWIMAQLLLLGISTIVNQVLMLIIWYFITIWIQFAKVVSKINCRFGIFL